MAMNIYAARVVWYAIKRWKKVNQEQTVHVEESRQNRPPTKIRTSPAWHKIFGDIVQLTPANDGSLSNLDMEPTAKEAETYVMKWIAVSPGTICSYVNYRPSAKD